MLKSGKVETLEYLNSFFREYERAESQTKKLKRWIGKQSFEESVVLVTHQVNITALTGVYPSSGELVFITSTKSGDISVLGTIKTE